MVRYGQSGEEEVVTEDSEIRDPPGYCRENNIGEWLKNKTGATQRVPNF